MHMRIFVHFKEQIEIHGMAASSSAILIEIIRSLISGTNAIDKKLNTDGLQRKYNICSKLI